MDRKTFNSIQFTPLRIRTWFVVPHAPRMTPSDDDALPNITIPHMQRTWCVVFLFGVMECSRVGWGWEECEITNPNIPAFSEPIVNCRSLHIAQGLDSVETIYIFVENGVWCQGGRCVGWLKFSMDESVKFSYRFPHFQILYHCATLEFVIGWGRWHNR